MTPLWVSASAVKSIRNCSCPSRAIVSSVITKLVQTVEAVVETGKVMIRVSGSKSPSAVGDTYRGSYTSIYETHIVCMSTCLAGSLYTRA